MPSVAWNPTQIKFDYDVINGSAEIIYMGTATEWAADTDPSWTVKKFTWIVAGDGTTQLAGVQVLGNVAWADRSTLDW